MNLTDGMYPTGRTLKRVWRPTTALRRIVTLAACLSAADATTTDVPHTLHPYEVTRAIIPGNDLIQVGLLYRAPVRGGSVPGVVVLHGWAPAGTVGAALVAELAFDFQQAGYAALTVSLRGWPETGGFDDCGAQQADDAVRAVQWLAQQPEVDATRIALVGHSQGGQVALLAGAANAPVAALVAYAPVTDLELWGTMTLVPGIQAYLDDQCSRGAGLASRSPVRAAGRIRAPVLLIHGTRDTRVHLLQSVRMADAMRKLGKRVELVTIPDAGHHWSDLGGAQTALEFLRRNLADGDM